VLAGPTHTVSSLDCIVLVYIEIDVKGMRKGYMEIRIGIEITTSLTSAVTRVVAKQSVDVKRKVTTALRHVNDTVNIRTQARIQFLLGQVRLRLEVIQDEQSAVTTYV
jgi:hypothetical protein